MRFTSCIPALDMLTIQLDPLSKPVGPMLYMILYKKERIFKILLSNFRRSANLRKNTYIRNPFNLIKKHTRIICP